jgi:hypothetical protein
MGSLSLQPGTIASSGEALAERAIGRAIAGGSGNPVEAGPVLTQTEAMAVESDLEREAATAQGPIASCGVT